MATMTLKASRREGGRKGPSRRLRVQGQIPAVVYGHGFEPELVSVPATDLNALLRQRTGTVIIDLKFGDAADDSHLTVVRSIQREPVTGRVIHIDLQRISLEEKVHVQVPLHIVGTAPGVKEEGGILEYPLRHLEIKCLPRDIPEFFEVDISSLRIGDSIHVREMTLDAARYDLLSEPEMVVVTVSAPRLLKVEAEVPAEAAVPAEGAEEEGEPEEGKDKKDKDKKDKDKDKEEKKD